MKFYNNTEKKQSINLFEEFALESNLLNKVRGGNGTTPDIWVPDEDEDEEKQ